MTVILNSTYSSSIKDETKSKIDTFFIRTSVGVIKSSKTWDTHFAPYTVCERKRKKEDKETCFARVEKA